MIKLKNNNTYENIKVERNSKQIKIMSANLRKYLGVLQFITSIKDKKIQNGILKQYATKDDFYAALREIATNTVSKNLPLTKSTKRKLIKHKKSILNLTKVIKSKKERSKKILQSGGFIQYLIPIVASLLSK